LSFIAYRIQTDCSMAQVSLVITWVSCLWTQKVGPKKATLVVVVISSLASKNP